MPYQNFPTLVEAISNSPAIPVLRLRAIIHEASMKNFSVVADRIAIKDLFANVQTHFDLFSQTKRFPEGTYFVFIDLNDWNKKWQDLQSALDFKPGDKDPKKYIPPPRQQQGEGETFRDYDANDASMVFRNTLRVMSNQLARFEGCFDRVTFENVYRLIWRDDDTTGQLFDEKFRLRIRNFYIDPANIHSDAWPGLANVLRISNLPDTEIDGDQIFIWGDRSLAERPRIAINTYDGSIFTSVSVATAD